MRNYIKKLQKVAVATEIYRFTSNNNRVHTDNLKYIDTNIDELTDEQLKDAWVELADEEYYNRTINANCGETDDYEELYGDKDAEVLLVILSWRS